jgi:hypothetical protein
MTQKKEADLLPWILGSLVVVVAAVGLIVASNNKDDSDVRSPKIRPAAVAANPTQSRPALVAPRAMPTVGTPRRVWECAVNGQKTFSDAPCGVGSTVRELSPVNRMNSTPTSPTRYRSPPKPAYAPSYEPQGSAESTNSSAVCEALDAEVKAIDERTRHRYTNPEGEYYRDRLHKISARRYDLHCDR